jgi:hypothetical protein
MTVKEMASKGGKARAKKLGTEGLAAHAMKMVAARKRVRKDNEDIANQRSQPERAREDNDNADN